MFDSSRVRAGELPPTPGLQKEQRRPGHGQDACPASQHRTLLALRPSAPGVTCPRAPSSAPRHAETHRHHCRGHHGPSSGQGCLLTAGLGEEDLVTGPAARLKNAKLLAKSAGREGRGWDSREERGLKTPSRRLPRKAAGGHPAPWGLWGRPPPRPRDPP